MLNQEERELLKNRCFEKCQNSFFIKTSKMDVKNVKKASEAFFESMLDSFDKKKIPAKIADKLELSFKNYFYGRIRFYVKNSKNK
jgi:hypothetical protein